MNRVPKQKHFAEIHPCWGKYTPRELKDLINEYLAHREAKIPMSFTQLAGIKNILWKFCDWLERREK